MNSKLTSEPSRYQKETGCLKGALFLCRSGVFKGRRFFIYSLYRLKQGAKFLSSATKSISLVYGGLGFARIVRTYKKYGFFGAIGRIKKNFVKKKLGYFLWLKKHCLAEQVLSQQREAARNFLYQPTIGIITPVYNPKVQWLQKMLESVRQQTYGNWELCIADASTEDEIKQCLKKYSELDARIKVKFLGENKGIAANSNEALALATGEFIALLDHDDELTPDALYEVVKFLQDHNADMIYTDEDKLDIKGNRCDPFFKPDWSLDMFLSYMYTCHLGVYRKRIVDELGGFREGYDGGQDYDLVLRFIGKTNSIFHIPKVLYHWRMAKGSTAASTNAKCYACDAAKKALSDYLARNGIAGEVLDGFFPTSYRIKRKILGVPLVSILLPIKDEKELLEQCLNSIFKKTNYSNYEIIIIDNSSIEKETHDYLAKLSQIGNIKVLQYEKTFNYSAINNFAVGYAKGEVLLFLNNDTEVISEEWLSAMLEHVQRKEVGAAGCKLLYPNRTIQHAGVIIGLGGVAGHSHRFSPINDDGRVNVIQNLSAVTSACMMVRKDVFSAVGGFDEQLTVAFNDVDLCLKIRDKGYLIVYTPYAELYRKKSMKREHENTPEAQSRLAREIEYIKGKWGGVIVKGDPYYNPNLTLDKEDFSIGRTE